MLATAQSIRGDKHMQHELSLVLAVRLNICHTSPAHLIDRGRLPALDTNAAIRLVHQRRKSSTFIVVLLHGSNIVSVTYWSENCFRY